MRELIHPSSGLPVNPLTYLIEKSKQTKGSTAVGGKQEKGYW